jgi:hypothetical protein
MTSVINKDRRRKIPMTGKGNACISEELLWRYIEEDTDDRETRMVRNHINRCTTCFSIVASVLYNEIHPFTDQEKAEVDKLLSGDREKFISAFLQKYRENEGINAINGREDAVVNLSGKGMLDKIMKKLKAIRFLQPAVAFATIFAVGVLVWQIFFTTSQNIFDKYVYDDSPPDLPVSGFRSSGAAAESGSWQETLYNAIVNNYSLQSYENAIGLFETIEPVIQALPPDSMVNKVIVQLRDLYFYKGVSHFAISRSKKRNLTQSQRSLHIEKAVQALSSADSLVHVHNLAEGDREVFFLGIALGFRGNKSSAIAKLKEVPRESRFFKESVRLIREWQEE